MNYIHRSFPGKKTFFYIVLLALPFTFLLLLEIGLRIFSFGDNLKLFIPASDAKYLRCNPIVGKRFFNKNEFTTPLNDVFLKEKPADSYRIFVLGESTVQGFPYDANLAFTRILQWRLQDIFPDRNIEIINLGMTAISSYTLLDFTEEIIDQKPDAVLIYTGHNEYYGALGVGSMENGSIASWMKKIHLKLIHLRTYQLVQTAIRHIYKLISPMSSEAAKMTLMQRMVGKNIIPYGSEKYYEGLNQFSNNMELLLSRFKKQHIPVIISDLVSNEKDIYPFKSIRYKNFPPADQIFSEAKRLETDSSFEKARDLYIKSKDLDAIRFRASEDLNKIIASLAASYGDYLVSLKSLFEKHSPHGIVGDNLMTEHLHPNVDGYFLMAEGFLNALKEHGMIGKNWNKTEIKPWTYYKQNWGVTEIDSIVAVLRIKHLKSGWPFKPENVVNNFIFTYKPKGFIDSLAFLAVKYDDVSLEKLHKKLASYYASTGDFAHASKEYLALACTSPFNKSFYYYSADFAYKAKDYNSVISILKKMPDSETNVYSRIILSSAYFAQKKYGEALNIINDLQTLKLEKKDYLISAKLKYNVLKDSGLVSEANDEMNIIKTLEPGFNGKDKDKKIVVLIPDKIKPYIEKAELLKRNGQLQDAFEVLKTANKIQETAYTNLSIGKILLSQRNLNALYYFEKAKKEFKDDPTLASGLCLLYILKRDFTKAKAALNDYARLKGENDPQVLRLRAVYEEQMRQSNHK